MAADFAESLKKGVKAAKESDKNRKEIQAIFDELDKSIKKFTRNKVGIVKAPNLEIYKTTDELIKAAKIGAKKKYPGGSLFLYSENKNRIERVADWHQAESDFAFSLVYEGKQVIAKSKEQLETAIRKLLESPAVGSALMSHDNSLSAEVTARATKAKRNSPKSLGTAVIKPAVKPNAAKPAKPAAKPNAAKPAKPAAKPNAAKPAKPAPKPTAKSGAKPAPKARIQPGLAR